MKYCGGCKQTKDESEFNKNRKRKDGLSTQCRECGKEYYQRHRKTIAKKRKEYRIEHREVILKQNREYKKQHRKVLAEKALKYELNRRKNDTQFAIVVSLRNRLRNAMRRGDKRGSAVRDLGCSIEELLEHLESQFYDERMSWDTWGKEWQIDHIYPLSAADLGDRVQFLAANNWRNLQPLTIAENKSKGSTVTPEAQLLFDELCDMFRQKEEAA